MFPLIHGILSQGGITYLFRDRFLTDRTAGNVDGTNAEPGPGARDVTDIESVIFALADRLRGGGQTVSAVWGESKIVWPAISRAAGRVFAARVLMEDGKQDLAIGFASADSIGDPTADGHAWYTAGGGLKATTPGATITIDSGTRAIRGMMYLTIVMLDTTGATLMLSTIGNDTGAGMNDPLGIPQYPSARVVWIDRAGSAASLYPFVSYYSDILGYPNGHAIEDVRVVDVSDWGAGNALATVFDAFTRANSATSLGGNWVADAGTWGISSNAGYVASGSGFIRAYLPNTTAAGDGIVICDITVPTTATDFFGLMLRRQDANNFIRLFNNGSSANIYLQTWVAGGFGAAINSTAQTWVGGQTYTIVVAMVGNRYSVWVDGVLKMDWVTDSNSRFITATSNGLYAGNTPTGARWDNFGVYPLTVTLPSEIQDGAVPLIYTAGATLASDTFTDSNGTSLSSHTAENGGAWTLAASTWAINSNAVAGTVTIGTTGHATQNAGSADAECSVNITVPNPVDAATVVRAGIVGRLVDTANYYQVRLFIDPSQPGEDEIEIIETIGGSGGIVHKASLADFFASGVTYTLKVQFKGDLIHVFLDGKPRISYYMPTGYPTGTNFGLYVSDTDDGCTFDNWSVKAL